MEIDFATCRTSGEFFYSWRMKEFQGDEALGLTPTLRCPARFDPATTARIQDVALRAHRILGCRDLSRTDIRFSRDGTPFILEVNPLPGLSPLDGNFPILARAAGISHETLIQRIVTLSTLRDGQSCRRSALARTESNHQDGGHGALPQRKTAAPAAAE